MPQYRILAINPGSTSTKMAVFDDGKPVFIENIKHTMEEVHSYNRVIDQFEFRKELVLEKLDEKGIPLSSLNAVVGRGGLVRPIEGGTYRVRENMVKDLETGITGQHVTSLGGIIAYSIASEHNIPAYIVDPPIVDEFEDVARISGMPEIERKSIFHALNQRAVAKRYAKEKGLNYEDLNLIVVHLGGGISIGAHKKGRIVDVNNALDGEGPFSPERTGSLPVGDLVKLCYSGKYTLDEMLRKIVGKGGLVAYVGTNDVKAVHEMAQNGDKNAELVFNAMAYQVAKEIGAASTVLYGKVDAILLTGGIAYSTAFTDMVSEKVRFIAPIAIYPGENEMLALAEGCFRVLNGEEKAKEY